MAFENFWGNLVTVSVLAGFIFLIYTKITNQKFKDAIKGFFGGGE